MSPLFRSSVFAIAIATLGACAGHQRGAALSRRASFDLQCPRNQLSAVQIDERTVGVSGCGRRATYVESCASEYSDDCTWVMNANNATTSGPKPEPVSGTGEPPVTDDP